MGKVATVQPPSRLALAPLGRRVELPYDEELEYLESTGTQYVNPNVRMVDVGAVELDWEYLVDSKSFLVFGGGNRSGYNTAKDRVLLASVVESGAVKSGYIDTGIQRKMLQSNWISGSRVVIPKIKCDVVGGGEDDNRIIGLFRNYNVLNNITASGASRCRMCRIWDKSDTLVRDFIPVRYGSVGYLYDRVSNTRFKTGTFVCGPDKTG